MADAAGALDQGDLAAVGGLAIGVGEGTAVVSHAGRSRVLPGRSSRRKLIGPGVQVRRLEAAVADGVGREGHLIDEGRVVASQRGHTEELDGVHAGGHGKRQRLVAAIQGVYRIDGGADLHAIDQDFDFFIIRLVNRTLGSQERELVRAGVQVDGLANAAVVLHAVDDRAFDVTDLHSRRGVLGFYPVRLEVAAITGQAGRFRELPGRAVGIGSVGIGSQGWRLEAAIDQPVDHRRNCHVVDEGGAVGTGRTGAEEFDDVQARRYREIRRFVGGIGGGVGFVIGSDRNVGNDHADFGAIDQDLDSLGLGLVVDALRGEHRKVVDASVQIDGLADAGVILDEGHLVAAGGLGITGGEGAGIGAHACDA